MAQFSVNNGLISRDNSSITGSLNVTGWITASHFGTSSYVVTASYSLNSDTASYTATTSVLSASYATTTISSSVAQTASVMINPSYGPTPSIGYISPNITMLASLGATTLGPGNSTITTSLAYGGFFPFMVNKDCTLVTMSMLGAAGNNNTTCSLAIYSNSTSSLPQFLLVTGSIRVAIANTTILLYETSNFTPLKLNANNVYWVTYTSNAAGAFYAWRQAFWPAFTSPTYNPLLGYAITTSGSAANFLFPMWTIKSGSFVSTFPATASQSTASYFAPSASYLSPFLAPYLKVTYP